MQQTISLNQALKRYPSGISKRVLSDTAKKYGCIRKMGRVLYFLEQDLKKLDEILLCPTSLSKDSPIVQTGISVAQLTTDEEFGKARERLTGNKPKSSKRGLKMKCSNVTSLVTKQ